MISPVFTHIELTEPGGGIIFLVRKSLKFTSIQDLCGSTTDNLKTGVIRIHNLNPTLNLIACYRVPGRSVSEIEWNQFFSSLSAMIEQDA